MKKVKTVVSALSLSLVMLFTACSGDSSVEFKRGSYDEAAKKYTTETFGFSVSFDDTWKVYNDSELAQLSGMTASTDEDFKKQLETEGVIFDLAASLTDASKGTSVNITVEDLKVSGNSGLSEESYAEAAADQVKEQFEAQGAKVERAEKGKVTFAGKESACVFFKVTQNGNTVYETQVPVKKGNYMATITFASVDEKTVEELIKKFSAV